MKTLNAVTLAVAMVLALTLGTTAFADQTTGQAEEPFIGYAPAGAFHAGDVIGKAVKDRRSGDEVGEIDDLVISADGRILGVLITTGRIWGLGGMNIGLHWAHLDRELEADDAEFYVDMNQATLESAPMHERD